MRRLIIILGDQLNRDSAVFDQFDPSVDCVWMAEVPEEATRVWSHKVRIALFLSAMRHFRDSLREEGFPVLYHQAGTHHYGKLADALRADLIRLRPEELTMVQAGEFRVQEDLAAASQSVGSTMRLRPDRHFFLGSDEFAHWAGGQTSLRNEHLYRRLRAKTGILMDGSAPHGGRWNFDADNRKRFGRRGPGTVPAPLGFAHDAVTRAVIADVETYYPDHPGSLAHFDWPVTPQQAEVSLADFIAHRLPRFGPHQDAMWTGQTVLFHSRLSAVLNLKLISPRRVIDAALAAYREGAIPLASAEGFIRQILGWREFVHGIYWQHMPGYMKLNALHADRSLPAFYWTAATEMACLSEVIGQTLQHGYAHHIQRLMVTGLFALLLGVHPEQVHQWYLAIFADAVEWVELPNTLGMSQYADGGIMGSKPYVASGRYIQRMSNYCQGCRYRPDVMVGPDACPFTTLYWDFLLRHRSHFERHPRTAFQWRQLNRLDSVCRQAVRAQAERLRDGCA